MKIKTTTKIIFIISLLCLFVCIGTIFAQDKGGDLEVKYPSFGGADSPQNTKYQLTSYIRYIYNFAIICGGLIALMSLIYGGFRFLTSAGNPAAITDARGQILAGLLGLVVIFGSYIILNELNPDLVSLRMPSVLTTGRMGIILYNTTDCDNLGVDASSPETTDKLQPGTLYKAINDTGSTVLIVQNPDLNNNNLPQNILPLSFYSFHIAQELTLEFFSNAKCEGTPDTAITNLQRNQCQNIGINGIQCVKFIWRTPGIWVFNTLDRNQNVPDPTQLPEGFREGEQYLIFQSSQEMLDRGFSDNIKGIAIVPNEALGRNYGVIAHNYPRRDSKSYKKKDWAHIYLPGCGTNDSNNDKCDTNGGNVTLYGPFDGEYSHISSLTIFNVPETIGSISPITICREDKCEPPPPVEKNGSLKEYDGVITYDPAIDFDPITGIFGTGGSGIYMNTAGIIYGKKLEGVNWDSGNPIILRKDSKNIADGISAIEIGEGGSYLALLYENLSLEFGEINDDITTSADFINATNVSLRTIQMDGRVGTIVIINTDPGQNY
ncbi:MAG: hypothetical protein NTY11_02310 [Candidatus Parcubacteria bacterium]|nr:hypothetical protein [Candidatus Parcubacteria bacterium]